MKRGLRAAIGVGVATPLIVCGIAFAEDNPKVTSDDTTKTTAVASDNKGSALTTEQRQDLQKRLQERVAKQKTKLQAAEQARIKERCSPAQGKISALSGRVKGIETSRIEVYNGVIARLGTLQTKLTNQGANTAGLQAEITELKAKVATYTTDIAAYKQTVADLATMDCSADPAAFKASLEAARASLVVVRQDAVNIRKYVQDTIKPTLQEIRSKLTSTKQGEDS
jgi:septation ring formation regulator EzrA